MISKVVKAFILGVYYHAWEIVDYGLTVLRFYRKPSFAITDLLLQLQYLFSSADRLCFHFLKNHPEDQVQFWYGETSLHSFKTMCQSAQVRPEDHLFDLGCGRGRLVFWAERFLNCTATGVDLNPTFITRAQRIQHLLRRKKLHFLKTNLLEAPLSAATVVYLYGTAFEESAWPNLISALKKTRPGTRIITVSKSLSDWGGGTHFRQDKILWLNYIWGKAPVYIQTRTEI